MSPVLARWLLALGRAYVRHAPSAAGTGSLVAALDTGLRRYPKRCLTRTSFGAIISVNTSDFIQRFIYLFGTWEPHLTAWFHGRLKPGDAFIDVGANVGYFSLLGAKLVGPSGRVIAIEASPHLFETLQANLQLNGCKNARAVHRAASDVPGRLDFYCPRPANLGFTTCLSPNDGSHPAFSAVASPLPELLDEAEVSRARVIKIDVEGAEASVVQGLTRLLPRIRRDAELAIEVSPGRLVRLGRSVREVLDPLIAQGFHIYRVTNDYRAQAYPACRPRPPVRWRAPVTEQSDLIFSRIDAETLFPL